MADRIDFPVRVLRWTRRHPGAAILIAGFLVFLLAAFCGAPALAAQALAPASSAPASSALSVRVTSVDTLETMVLHRFNWARTGTAERQQVSYGVGQWADSVGIRSRDTTRMFFLPRSADAGWACITAWAGAATSRHCRPIPPTIAAAAPVDSTPADTLPRDSLPAPQPPRDTVAPQPPRDTTPTPVPGPQPDPGETPGAVAPFYAIRWDTLTTERHRASPLPKFSPASQTIDREAPPAPGATASLRIDYAAKRASDPDKCNDHSVGFTPIGDGAPVTYPPGTREVWTELWVRWEPGYDTRAPAEWQCPRAADQKIWRNYPHIPAGAAPTFDALNVGNQGGAFVLFPPSGRTVDGIAAATNVRGPDLWTGQWIRFRIHSRLSCSREYTGRGTVDVAWFDTAGRLVKEARLWADGKGYIQYGPDGPGAPYDGTAVASYDRKSGVPYCSYAYARVGMNRNLHPPRPLRMWYGPYLVHLSRPKGWKE